MSYPSGILYFVDTVCNPEFFIPEKVYPEESWLLQYSSRGVCPHCRCINRCRYPQPFDIVLQNPPQGQTSVLVEEVNITLWRRDFLEFISPYLKGFVIGKCYLPGGEILADYAACYHRHMIVVRGNRSSRYSVCPLCGAILSETRPGPEYVLKRYLTDDHVYQDALCRFFLSEELAWKQNFNNWGNEELAVAALKSLSVRDEPADGKTLPGD